MSLTVYISTYSVTSFKPTIGIGNNAVIVISFDVTRIRRYVCIYILNLFALKSKRYIVKIYVMTNFE